MKIIPARPLYPEKRDDAKGTAPLSELLQSISCHLVERRHHESTVRPGMAEGCRSGSGPGLTNRHRRTDGDAAIRVALLNGPLTLRPRTGGASCLNDRVLAPQGLGEGFQGPSAPNRSWRTLPFRRSIALLTLFFEGIFLYPHRQLCVSGGAIAAQRRVIGPFSHSLALCALSRRATETPVEGYRPALPGRLRSLERPSASALAPPESGKGE